VAATSKIRLKYYENLIKTNESKKVTKALLPMSKAQKTQQVLS
jgi:hypothetical protein